MHDIGNESRGVVWVAIGWWHLLMASLSATSLRLHSDLSTLIVADTDLEASRYRRLGFDFFEPARGPRSDNRLAKISMYWFSPFTDTLFLDADTIVCRDPSPGFQFLDFYDLALRSHHEPLPDLELYNSRVPLDRKLFSSWNSGVVFFRKGFHMEAFFNSWKENFVQLGSPYDQPALVRTVLEKSEVVKVLSLNLAWNVDRRQAKKRFPRAWREQVIDHYRDNSGVRSKLRSHLHRVFLPAVGDGISKVDRARLIRRVGLW